MLSNPELGDVGFTDEELKQFVDDAAKAEPAKSDEIQESFEVVVECRDEGEQKQLYERLTAEGYSCRLFTL